MGIQNDLLGMAGRKVRERYRALYGPDPEPSSAAPLQSRRTTQLPDDPLADVKFASAQAREKAEEAGLNWSDFAFTPTGSTGQNGWRADDVRRIIAEQEEEAE